MLTVVIPAHNPSGDDLERAVRSVRLQLPAAQVIIVDDGSDLPVTAEGATIERTTGMGPGGARNHGARLAAGSWLLFLDDDDELLPGATLFEDATAHAEPGVQLVCGPAILEREGRQTLSSPLPVEGLPGAPRLSSLAGSFAVSRDLFELVGGYDAELRFGENTDLIIRCASVSGVSYVPEPTVKYMAAVTERHYDARRLRAVEHLLERGRPDLEHQPTRSRMHGIASVNAGRLGHHRSCARHARRSFCTEPNPRTLARLLASLTGPISGYWWRRRGRR